jgi:hypothetical protein
VQTSEEESDLDNRPRGSDSDVESDWSEGQSKGRKRLKRAESEEKEDEELRELEREFAKLESERSSTRQQTRELTEMEREFQIAALEEKLQTIRTRIDVKRMVIQRNRGRPATGKSKSEREEGINKLKAKHGKGKKTHEYVDESSQDERVAPTRGRKNKDEKVADLELNDIHQCCVTRSDIGKWDYFSFMDKVLHGAFVRYLIGQDPKTKQSVYRLCRVEKVESQEREYRLEHDKPRTTKHVLILSHGKAVKQFTCDNISNRLPTEVRCSIAG